MLKVLDSIATLFDVKEEKMSRYVFHLLLEQAVHGVN